MTTRRDILIGTSCAVLAAAAPLALAASRTNVRRNIVDIENDPGALQALRDAIDVLRKKDDYGKRPAIDGWFALATTHSHWCFGNTARYEVHYGWWFLPWHRAYLIHVERALQEAINEPLLTIPYWDWVMTPQLPASVSALNYRNGNNTRINPLFDDQRYGPVGQGGAINFVDLGAPGKTEAELIAIDSFANFAGGQPGADLVKRPGFLEATPHTYIHRAIGFDQPHNRVGLMTVGMAPLDPVFFLHHANVDRLWQAWLNAGGRRQNPDDPAWREHHFAFPETRKFKLIDYRIADLLDTERSAGHYRYDRDHVGDAVPAIDTLVLRGVPISSQPATIRVFAGHGPQRTLVGAFSTIPSTGQTAGKMDVVLPIGASVRSSIGSKDSIAAEFAESGAPVSFDDFALEPRR